MVWMYSSLPAAQNFYDYQSIVTTDGLSATDTLSNAALLALIAPTNPIRRVLTTAYPSAFAAAEALMRAARVRAFSAAAGTVRGWGFSVGIDGGGFITITLGHDGALVVTNALLEIEFRHSYVA